MKRTLLAALSMASLMLAQAELPSPVFQADFNDQSNLLKATKGNDLVFSNAGGELAYVDGPQGSGAVTVPKGSYFTVDISNSDQFNANGYINAWSMSFDVKFPQMGTWYAFFQTTEANNDDAEVFINSSSNGIGGYYATGLGTNGGYSDYAFEANKWYRITFNYDCAANTYAYYVDGQLLLKGNNGNAYQDSRFALPKRFLLFGDNDGDDGTFDVASVKIFDKKLSASACRELGGFGNVVTPNPMPEKATLPFLYDPQSNMQRISWHGSTAEPGTVNYGIAADALSMSAKATAKIMDDDDEFILNTVKLTDLTPNTVYYYQIAGSEDVYKFKTLPAANDIKRVRFLVVSDTHCQGTSDNAAMIMGAAKTLVASLYPGEERPIDFILHNGDVADWGDNVQDYGAYMITDFKDWISEVPMLAVPGNHDLESPNFYAYFRNDDISGQPEGNDDYCHYWKKQFGSMLLLGLDSWSYWPYEPSVLCRDRTPGLGEREVAWLDETLAAAEKDPQINMVFIMCHECPASELWYAGWKYTFTNESLYPVIRKYSKVQQISFGHAHGMEYGASLPYSDNTTHDIMLFNAGNGGGYLDAKGVTDQQELAEINKSIAEFGINIGEVDIENGKYNFQTWAVGANGVAYEKAELREEWYGDVNQEAPAAPANVTIAQGAADWTVKCDAYDGNNPGKLFSTQWQLCEKTDGDPVVLMSSLRDVRNYYIDTELNEGIDLCSLTTEVNGLEADKEYFVRVRFRDDNRKWSAWASNLDGTGVKGLAPEAGVSVFTEAATSSIYVVLPAEGATVRILDMSGRELANAKVDGRSYCFNYGPKGVYIVSVEQNGTSFVKKVIAK